MLRRVPGPSEDEQGCWPWRVLSRRTGGLIASGVTLDMCTPLVADRMLLEIFDVMAKEKPGSVHIGERLEMRFTTWLDIDNPRYWEAKRILSREQWRHARGMHETTESANETS